jgi:hypothetical protein
VVDGVDGISEQSGEEQLIARHSGNCLQVQDA